MVRISRPPTRGPLALRARPTPEALASFSGKPRVDENPAKLIGADSLSLSALTACTGAMAKKAGRSKRSPRNIATPASAEITPSRWTEWKNTDDVTQNVNFFAELA